MRTWLYDGSFEGLLTCLSLLVESGEEPVELDVRTDHLPLFSEVVHVSTHPGRARAFLDVLREKTSAEVVHRVVRVAMVDRVPVGVTLYRFLRLALERGPEVIGYYAHPDVRAVHDMARSVGREIHRLKGLVRFRETDDGWLWGPIAPDHNVSAAVAQHFRRRMPAERWVIHDVARRLMVAWDGRDWVLREQVDPHEIRLSAHEGKVQEWWRAFYRETAVAERTRPRLQARNMPRRYWTYLIEEPMASRSTYAESRRQTFGDNPAGDK